MKVYSLYYKDNFVVAFPTREDCIEYGKKYYAEYCWDCNIIQEQLTNSMVTETYNVEHGKPPNYKDWVGSSPFTQKMPWTCVDGPESRFTVDYTKPFLTNYYEGPKAQPSQKYGVKYTENLTDTPTVHCGGMSGAIFEPSQGHRRKDMDMLG